VVAFGEKCPFLGGKAMPGALSHLVHHVAVDELDPAGIFQRTRLNDPLVLVDGDPVERRRSQGGGDETFG
jgi:hypothetical protein